MMSLYLAFYQRSPTFGNVPSWRIYTILEIAIFHERGRTLANSKAIRNRSGYNKTGPRLSASCHHRERSRGAVQSCGNNWTPGKEHHEAMRRVDILIPGVYYPILVMPGGEHQPRHEREAPADASRTPSSDWNRGLALRCRAVKTAPLIVAL